MYVFFQWVLIIDPLESLIWNVTYLKTKDNLVLWILFGQQFLLSCDWNIPYNNNLWDRFLDLVFI